MSGVGPIHAVVFDSNIFGRAALPNVETIRLWSQAAAAHGAELWVPEVVAYELAQHAVEEHKKAVLAHEAHQKKLLRWGQQPGAPMPPLSFEDIVGAVSAAGAVIIDLDGEDALEAIFDQVLLRGVGARKSGVKTGAADSAWVRSIIAHNGGASDGLLVVTGDTSALERTCEELGVDPPVHAHHLREVGHLLEEASPATPDQVARFQSWLDLEFVADRGRVQQFLPDMADIGDAYNGWDVDLPGEERFVWELQREAIGPVISAVPTGTVEHDAWTQSLVAVVELTCSVEEQYARQDPFGDYVQYRLLEYPGRVRATVRLFDTGGGLVFDGDLDDIELVSPEEAEVFWDPT